MKSLLLIGMLIFSSIVFGQSKKEINAQLRKELAYSRDSYDSIRYDFSDQFSRLSEARGSVKSKLVDLGVERRQILQLYTNILQNYEKLVALGFDADSLVEIEKVRKTEIPNFKSFYPQNTVFTEQLETEKVIDTLNIDKLKMKTQKEQMRTQIELYSKVSASNLSRLQRVVELTSELETTDYKLDSVSERLTVLNKQFPPMNNALKNQLDKLEENYRKNGPKGFSKAYEEQFPHVFPKKPMPSIDDNEKEYPDVNAEFPGGENAMREYLAKNMRYPKTAIENQLQGTAYIRFNVSETGTISNVNVLKGVFNCAECDAEAVRLIKAMPIWIPAKKYDKAVNSEYTFPVKFKL